MEAEKHGYTGVAEIPTKGVSLRKVFSIKFSASLCYIFTFFCSGSSPVLYACLLFTFLSTGACGLGSIATIAVSYDGNGEAFVCGIMQGNVQSLQCWNNSNTSIVSVSPLQASFLGVSGGQGFVCGLRSDTGRPFCWNTHNLTSPKRLKNQAYSDIVSGTSHVCALSQVSTPTSNGSFATCWRNRSIAMAIPSQQAFTSLASGGDFVCGITYPENTVKCWGDSVGEPPNAMFSSIQAGSNHACGVTDTFNVMCWGDNTHNQLVVPDGKQFLSLALGTQHSCGIEAFTRNVMCWGNSNLAATSPPTNVSFSTIAAGDYFTCGIVFNNLSIICWGASFSIPTVLSLKAVIPSACTSMACESRSFQQTTTSRSSSLCSSSQLHVCIPCRIACQSSFSQTAQCTAEHDITCQRMSPSQPGSNPPSPSPTAVVIVITRSRLSKGLIALTALGAFGALCGLLTVGWCIWAKCRGPVGFSFDGSQGRVHNSSIGNVGVLSMPPSNRAMKRQRSSTSSARSRGDITTGRAQAFTIANMAAATMGFSEENMIAAGSFGIVYRGMLPDGREVAIKRREKETVANEKKMEEKESAFQSELEFLSRLHHKHLVSLVGFCDEEDERMLVYDYMPNGTLHDHLHGSGQSKGEPGVLPWQMRIKIALEAARGVEYLHTYALPPIIHRDIKSSNILLDGGWNARVSDFGLSTRGPAENSHLSLMAAGTLGYMDPEYYRLQHLTIKSDVYSFGVVLLELLTGERAIHKQSHGPVNIVDYAVPRIVNHDLASVLDQRPGAPIANELKAIEMIAQLAAQCVRLEGKERPTMTEIVAVLEEAAAYTGNGRSRSQSSTVASLSAIPLYASATPFKHVEQATDTTGVPFEFIQVQGSAFESLEAGIQMDSVGPTESPEVMSDTQGDAFVVTGEGECAEPIELIKGSASNGGGEDHARESYTSGGGNEKSKTFEDVHKTSDMAATEVVETVSYSTFGGSGDAGSSETIEAFILTGGSGAVEPSKPHET